MRSAIFQDKPPHELAPGRKHVGRKTRLTPLSSAPPAPGSKWVLEELLTSYVSTGKLPPPLSPTLPARYRPFEPQVKKESDAQSKTWTGKSRSVPLVEDTLDIDTLPMSLLSPTLPKMFTDDFASATPGLQTNSSSSKKEGKQRAPGRGESPLKDFPKKVELRAEPRKDNRPKRVRWIDKSHEAKPRFLVRISVTPATKKQTLPPAESPVKKQAKKAPLSHWFTVASQLQQKADAESKDVFGSIITSFDMILCLAAGCEESTTMPNASVSSDEQHWTNLYHEISKFKQHIERHVKSGVFNDKRKSYLSFLVGVLTVMKALALKRVNEQLRSEISDSKNETATLHSYQKMDTNLVKIEQNLAESQSFFNSSPPPHMVFPKSWHKRSASFTRHSEPFVSPASENFYLPLGFYSDVRESIGYLFCCLSEFCYTLDGDARAKALKSASKK